MKSYLPKTLARIVMLAVVTLFISISATAQTWAFRNGWGSSAAGSETGHAICSDASGNVYITGGFVGTINFGTGNLTVPVGTQNDGFIAKFNSTGTCLWSQRFGGNLLDEGRAITTDGTNVYVGCRFNSSASFTVGATATAFNTTGGNDAVVLSFNASTGAYNSGNHFTGTGGGDSPQSMCVDGAGGIYMSGNFSGTVSFGGLSRTASGGSLTDLFVVKMNSALTVAWASTGGSSANFDNIAGSGICYVPALSEIVLTGSYSGVAPTYSTTSPVSSVTLPFTGGNELCLLEINASNGAFISGTGVGGGSGDDEGLAIAYDASTTDVVLTGYFTSPSITFGSNPALTNGDPGNADGFYARYNPTSNAFAWSKAAGTTGIGFDRVRGVAADGFGAIYITGDFTGTISLPTATTPLTLTNARTGGSDIFLARIKAADGNAALLGWGSGDNQTGSSNSPSGIAMGGTTEGSGAWITGSYFTAITFAPLTPLNANIVGTADILLAKYNTPLPLTATTSSTPITCNVGCNGTGTVTPSGGVSPYTYSWSPSGGNAATATGLCANTYTITITDAIGTQITRTITIAAPAYVIAPATTQNASFPVSPTNTIIADASCNLIANLLPIAPSAVTGNINARVWREAAVPVYGGKPYVQRHYEITPATNPTTATGRVTLYFTQAEFDNYNAHAGSTADLPNAPGDNIGKAALRVEKRNGQTNNGTGFPGSYTGTRTLITPGVANVNWNATALRWEVTFDITSGGWSGFFVHTFTAILPVNLLSFSGLITGNDVQVKWQTGSEADNDHFEVERSIDGINYTTVGLRPGNNGVGVRNYDLIDAGAAALPVNKLFYRLKIVETGGRIAYSNVVVIFLTKKGGFVTGILPNPFGTTLSITINAPKNGKMNMTVVDAAGRVVAQQQTTVNKGFSTQTVNDAAKLGAGVYSLLVEFDGETSVHKVVKQ
jgi:trimeric autotransporter adhesin